MKIGNKEFDIKNHTYIMGILNVTPDSFSDGGKWNSFENALEHTALMLEQGADIIDIGGESTRPGYTRISDEEEIARAVPVIRAVKEKFDTVISADTYKAKVAEAALAAGADLLNDIWGLKADPDIAGVIASFGAACCLMHNRDEIVSYGTGNGTGVNGSDGSGVVSPGTIGTDASGFSRNGHGLDLLEDLKREMGESIEIALKAGIKEDRIIIDPGIGFGLDYEQNLEVLRRLDEFCALPYPVLLGTSRKSVIAKTLNLPPEERVEGTLVTTVMAVQTGCAFVRVHDVKENWRTIKMTEAIIHA